MKTILLACLVLFAVLPSTTGSTLAEDYNNNNQTAISRPSINVEPFKVMTYNILESGKRPQWLDVVKEENPDIMVLVETGLWDDNNNAQLNSVLNELNSYFVHESPYQGYTDQYVGYSTSGVAILSRFPFIEFHDIDQGTLDNGQTYYPSHDFMHAKLNISNTIINIIGTHLKCCSGSKNEQKRDSAQELTNNYMDKLKGEPILYMGDLNTQSEEDRSFSTDLNLGTSTIDMLINPNNPHTTKYHTWKDVWRTLHPNDFGKSYISSYYNSRIDYIFANQFFFDQTACSTKFFNATTGDTKSANIGSDHYSVDTLIGLNASFSINSNLCVKQITTEKISTDTSTTSLLSSNSDLKTSDSFFNVVTISVIFSLVALKRRRKKKIK